uniref:Uncharacterized protein n=1 Tax=Prymnesium polylepis TaxID=72548 RepID=A0A7S4J4V7_9EUKA|mmetsp:Transcript_37633/g.103883  ORF Transcript_37633/g.103883 Transcript_37633/m.103883 type:complete len:155 (+) Transcript_37633:73-537(+)
MPWAVSIHAATSLEVHFVGSHPQRASRSRRAAKPGATQHARQAIETTPESVAGAQRHMEAHTLCSRVPPDAKHNAQRSALSRWQCLRARHEGVVASGGTILLPRPSSGGPARPSSRSASSAAAGKPVGARTRVGAAQLTETLSKSSVLDTTMLE